MEKVRRDAISLIRLALDGKCAHSPLSETLAEWADTLRYRMHENTAEGDVTACTDEETGLISTPKSSWTSLA